MQINKAPRIAVNTHPPPAGESETNMINLPKKPSTSLRQISLALVCGAFTGSISGAEGPSFPCDKVEAGSVEAMVCQDQELAALDRTLAEVYAGATQKAQKEHPPVLKAEQRGWIKGRNDCWKSEDQRQCVMASYQTRIAELQARYRLVPDSGAVSFYCDDDPGNEIIVTFFETDPPTLIAERGDSVSLMYRQPAASGSRYQGRNETFWEHHGEATVTWGLEASSMVCRRAESR
jgi:uncharacterized protein